MVNYIEYWMEKDGEITYHSSWVTGASRQGRITQSVKVRPGPKQGSRPRSTGGTVARKQDGEALRQHFLKGRCATLQVVTKVNAHVASLHSHPVAETVGNARRQQEVPVMSQSPYLPPAGYQRRHGAKGCAETGEVLGARRRNLDEEAPPITLNGKWRERHQDDGSGRSTVDPRALKRAGREGPGPGGTPLINARRG